MQTSGRASTKATAPTWKSGPAPSRPAAPSAPRPDAWPVSNGHRLSMTTSRAGSAPVAHAGPVAVLNSRPDAGGDAQGFTLPGFHGRPAAGAHQQRRGHSLSPERRGPQSRNATQFAPESGRGLKRNASRARRLTPGSNAVHWHGCRDTFSPTGFVGPGAPSGRDD